MMYLKWTRPGKLSHCGLHVVHRLPHEDEEDYVWKEEGSASVLICEVRETPHVADSHLKKSMNRDEADKWFVSNR